MLSVRDLTNRYTYSIFGMLDYYFLHFCPLSTTKNYLRRSRKCRCHKISTDRIRGSSFLVPAKPGKIR